MRIKFLLPAYSNVSDNLLGGGLDPASADALTMYNDATKEPRRELGSNIGLWSELGVTGVKRVTPILSYV